MSYETEKPKAIFTSEEAERLERLKAKAKATDSINHFNALKEEIDKIVAKGKTRYIEKYSAQS